jgi:hypothetical protein
LISHLQKQARSTISPSCLGGPDARIVAAIVDTSRPR